MNQFELNVSATGVSPTGPGLGDSVSIRLEVNFRVCTREDLKGLEWHGLFTAHRRIIRSAFQRQKRGTNLMLIAEANGMPVGQVWIDWVKKRRQGIGVLWAVRVLPWFQGAGIGKRLLELAEEAARRRGVSALELGVEKHNRQAERFYQRLGYERVGELREQFHYIRPDGRRARHKLNEWLMRKELRPQPPLPILLCPDGPRTSSSAAIQDP